MNRSALKKYAPQARLDFIEAVTLRARRLGLDPVLPVRVEHTGDVLLIGGQPFSASIAKQRIALVQRIHQQGFGVVVEALAYTWFNRLVAIRFMELKGYLSHGYRVLSHPQGQQPEILDNVQHLDLPGLDKAEVIRLKTAGNQDEALYREILLAQCHELHRNMPFLFEALDDATELLLPDNLLRTDSLIAHLVSDIEEGDWKEVEIIGWLYQFYISEKKDEVMGKVVRSEDIPAATQLFTPNWIVQYLVQNSLGRLWLMANPSSSLKEKMPYYIEPVGQTPEVQEQLDTLIKVRMDEDGGTLNPESLTVLDPACGSGHILVEAYNLLRAIYEERGYRLRDIPRLILQKNLFGLDIDDRAAQLAGFALLMKAREDDRRLFDDEGNPPHLNIMAIQQSAGLPDGDIAQAIINAAIQIEGGSAFQSGQLFGGGELETYHSSGLTVFDLRQLIQLFEHGKTFGSLLSVPDVLKAKLNEIIDLLTSVRKGGDDLSRSYASQVLEQFAWPASLMVLKYDAVMANPPYMGSKGMNTPLKEFAKKSFPSSKSDLFAMFIERGFLWCGRTGFNSMVTMQSWMFLSSYEAMRERMLAEKTITTLVQIGYNSFPEINSKVAQACVFNVFASKLDGFVGSFVDLNSAPQSADKNQVFLSRKKELVYEACQDSFSKIPGSPIAYWSDSLVLDLFEKNKKIIDVCEKRLGLCTGDNEAFLRYWYEINYNEIGFDFDSVDSFLESGFKYAPHNKGGVSNRWAGNRDYVIKFDKKNYDLLSVSCNRLASKSHYFRESLTWSEIGTGLFSVRALPRGYTFNIKGPSVFCDVSDRNLIAGYMNSSVFNYLLGFINQTISFNGGDIEKVPFISLGFEEKEMVSLISESAIQKYSNCCDLEEGGWGFKQNEMVAFTDQSKKISQAWSLWSHKARSDFESAKLDEERNNAIWIAASGLQNKLSAEVPDEQISLILADREKDMQRLISYAIGCIMGRYSLDEPGLIYAHSGGVGFDPSHYTEFPADADGIIPMTDESWFEDDAAERVREFVKVVWGGEFLVENMEWLADSLGRKAGESAGEAIRRYLSTSFYKDHLQTYKKRPIYWLFSSGKQKAFECLVYLHRYNEGTLSRMRMEYVVPLQSRMQARIDKLSDDISSATSSAQQKALQKRKEKLTKQLEELRRFDETLRPYADQRISLDLDDGIKANYGKFGDLLAEVKAITGGRED